jgi:uracil-DNA glycosylase
MEEEKVYTPAPLKSTAAGEFPLFDDWSDGLCTWKPHFENVVKSKTFSGLYSFLKTEYKSKKIYPPVDLIFNAFRLTPINKIKVVVVGQDPYHQPGQAMGLCFSVPRGVKVPSSLQNIYKSIDTDPKIKGFKKPTHGDLTKWATQGVFLLNTILTVEDSKADSHRKSGWDEFTEHTINVLNKECDGLVFLLWGLPAQKKAKSVSATKHHVLKTSHPSGLSYSKGFNTSFHFSQTNELLKKMGKTEIDWNLD